MTIDQLRHWIEAYERVWRTAGTDTLRDIFTADATYRPGPYEEPLAGLDALTAFWEAERDGPDEQFQMSWSPVAIDGDTAVVRVEVDYAGPPRQYRDLWIITLGADGRCSAFEEWPFHPGRPLVAGGR